MTTEISLTTAATHLGAQTLTHLYGPVIDMLMQPDVREEVRFSAIQHHLATLLVTYDDKVSE